MTRINLVPPEELTDQHLFAEFREIKMVAPSLRRSIVSVKNKYGESWEPVLLARIADKFTLNAGHVTFFYNKGAFLKKRFELLRTELEKREYNFNRDATFDELGVFEWLGKLWNNDYTPTPAEIEISQNRITERIYEKPQFYKYYGKPYIKSNSAY